MDDGGCSGGDSGGCDTGGGGFDSSYGSVDVIISHSGGGFSDINAHSGGNVTSHSATATSTPKKKTQGTGRPTTSKPMTTYGTPVRYAVTNETNVTQGNKRRKVRAGVPGGLGSGNQVCCMFIGAVLVMVVFIVVMIVLFAVVIN